jgi:ligand-binding sensor domain-containing protein
MMRVMSRRRVWLALGTIAGGAAVFGGWTVWSAQGVLSDARKQVAVESVVRFAMRPVVPSLPLGLESVGSPAVFRDAQVFHGHLFIAGPTGLAEYDNDYALIARYRVGAELPPAPLVALAVGAAADSGADELWIATAGEGLLAFDGRSFRQIRPEDAHFRKVTALLALGTGRILIGTEKSGVLVYDGRELKPFHASLTGLQVTALAGDDTSLWIGTIDRGLLHWNAGALDVIDDALPDRQVLSLALDGDALYAGTGMGVAEIRGGKFRRALATGYLAQTLLAANGKLWLGTLDEGMFEVPLDAHPGRGSRLGHASVCPDCSVRKILRIDGEVYTLAEDSLWRGAREVIRREDAVLADRNIAALAMDGSGRLWVGYFDRGLQILPAGGQTSDRGQTGERLEDDHLFCVNRIAHDASRGISAVATANGLVMFDASTARRRVITHDDGLIANQVTDVVLRPDGTAVAATPAGVSFIDASGISSIYAFQGLVNNHVYALASDGARTLVGTLGGLSILDGPIVRASYTTANSALKHNWVTSIVRVNEAWFIGTYGAGVLRMDAAGRLQSFDDLRGPLEINTNSMVATGKAVYAGTLDRGLAIYNLASGRWNFWTAGLPSRNVTAIEARGGFVYIGTDNGLVKLPESTLVNP